MTVEIAAWVLLACLLFCIGFAIRRERKHRQEIIGWEVQVQTLKDRVTHLQRRVDPRAGLHPGNPDAVVRTEEAVRIRRTYMAQRDFEIGSTGTRIPRGAVVQFDGRNLRYDDQTIEAPQVRGAVQSGWLRPVQRERQGVLPSMQAFNQQLQQLSQVVTQDERFNDLLSDIRARFQRNVMSDVQTWSRAGRELPPDWQERLTSPEAVEGLEPCCYEVGDEPVSIGHKVYEPGSFIPVEEMACLSIDTVRKFRDAGLIAPSQRDPRPTRYDRLTEDED